jgi:hypothetical protein
MLEGVPDQVLSRPLLRGEKFHRIEDLVFNCSNTVTTVPRETPY